MNLPAHMAFEMLTGTTANASRQGLRWVLRVQGAKAEDIGAVEAGIAAAVVTWQGRYCDASSSRAGPLGLIYAGRPARQLEAL